ncbi:MAG TPA: hypothetical protein VNZ64_26685 [Candidatus Acidoferrum sp.]|nr:hypothetical protein [Candidatus Acidoferrum sp.]
MKSRVKTVFSGAATTGSAGALDGSFKKVLDCKPPTPFDNGLE